MSSTSFLRCQPLALAARVLATILVMAASIGHAATASVTIGFDTDNNPATGCTLIVGGSSMPGVEVALMTTVTTTVNTGTVGAITRRTCTAGVFGGPVVVSAGGWPVGMGAGLSGSDLIETFIPLADLAGAAAVRIGVLTASDGLIAAAVFPLLASALDPFSAPTLSPGGMLILLLLLGATGWRMRRYARQGGHTLLVLCVVTGALTTFSALAIVLDGIGADWVGVAPIGTDPGGDAPAGEDLVALYAVTDGANLELRVDMRLARDVPGNQPPVVSAGPNQTVTLNSNGTLLMNLSGSVSDDGLPAPSALTSLWSVIAGPGVPVPVSFGDPALPTTQVGFAAPGTYGLRLTASDGAANSSRDVTINVNPAANAVPTLINPGNRTTKFGEVLNLTLATNDSNVRDTLSYSLPSAPAGAKMNPAGGPHLQFAPTALGNFNFTARVADQNGLSDQKSFTITVVAVNRAPQLAQPADATVRAGAAFSRVLAATDPDGDSPLVYSLLSAPGGMSVSGATLAWTPTLAQLGTHAVKVSVRDPSGAFDAKLFTLNVTSNVAPNAKDDSYEVNVGATLAVTAANGVLKNDADADGDALTATRLTDPGLGTLTAFNSDGGFTYTAPATLPPVPGLNPVVSWRGVAEGNNRFALAADLDHDGVVDYVLSTYGDFRAKRGSDGAQLWQFDKSITTHADISHCGTYINSEQFALGDVTGGGDIYLFASINCDTLGTAGQDDRYFAANASQILPGGKIATQWVSPRLSQPHPGAYATNASPTLPNPPVTPTYAASAGGSVPTLAKLTAGGSTKLVTRFLAASTYGYYYDTPNSGHLAYAACRTITALAADEGRACKATFLIDAATGAIEQVLSAPNPADEYVAPRNSPTEQNIPIIADLDGDGQVEIISGGDVWKLMGGVWTLAWQAQFDAYTGPKKSFEPSSVAVADLDGDGKAEVVFHLLANYYQAGGVYIFDHEGTLLRKIPISTNVSGLLSIADVDADGAPEILVAGDSFLYAYRPDGALLWAKRLPDILAGVVPPISSGGAEPMTSASQLYVYDLDLNGVPEVIVQGTRRLFILDGRTGAELWSIDTESDGFFQPGNPLLVDADGNGHIDIIVHLSERWNCPFFGSGPGGCKGNALRISGGDNNWAPGPKVQNQLNFRPAATNDAAQILYDSSIDRNFRQQIQQGTVVDPRIAQSTAFTYKANDGAADSAPATVLIDIKPQNRPPVITSTPPTGLLSVTPYARRVYTITATDPDPGDTVHYEFVSSTFDTTYFPAPTVDPVTGGVDIYSGPCGSFGGACDFGRVLVIVAAVDSHGARTEQSFFIDITYLSVAVPNVVGQLLPAASTAIDAASLTPLVVTELFGSQPAGTVIGQDPVAGTANVPRSATVKLTVSKGPAPVLVPNVTGLSEATAQTKLTGAGFTATVSRAFSQTAPRGQVIGQTPSAGTETVPAAAQIVVSSGSGLELKLARGAVAAGGSIGFTVLAFNADGSSALPPPVTTAVAVAGSALGMLPTVSGNNIVTDISTLGGFQLVATETGTGGRSARIPFAVLLAPAAGFSPQQPIQDLLQALATMETQRQTLDAALLANDAAVMRSTLRAMVTTWKGWEHKSLAQTPLLITPDKLPMTPAQLAAAGHGPSPEDVLDRIALEALTEAMRTVAAQYGGSSVPISAVRAALIDAAAAVKPLTQTAPSLHGIVSNLDYTTYLATRALPQSLSLFMREVDRTLTATPQLQARDHVNMAFSGSLAELSSATSIHMDLVKDYYGPIIWKVVASGAALAAQGLLREAGITGETAMAGIVTGASQSFHIFEAPGTFLELIGASELPEETQVWILGPSAIASAIGQIRGLIKGFAALKDLSSLNSQLAASNAAQAQALLLGNFTKITNGFKDFSEQLYANTNVVAEWPGIAGKGQGFFLAGNQVERGCIFTSHPECKQVFFGSGFPAAEKCDPRSFCIPLALLVITWTPSTMAFGADAVVFIPKYEVPCAKDPLLGISLPGVPPGCAAD